MVEKRKFAAGYNLAKRCQISVILAGIFMRDAG